MIESIESNLSNSTISKLGLTLSKEKINAEISPGGRIFDYPELDNVFIMENDLYGNAMPKDSCFLAFFGQHGLVGQHLTIEALSKASVADIKSLVDAHAEG